MNVIFFRSAAEVGIIEQVVIQNFLCHRYLEVNLGPNINFIHGANGSLHSISSIPVLLHAFSCCVIDQSLPGGKSAILTGIIVGLGGKANLASRGNSLKELVKTGERCERTTDMNVFLS